MKKKVLALLVLVAAGQAAAARAQDAPRAVVSEVVHDIGHVRQGQPVAHEFSVKNEGTAALLLDRVDFDLPGLTARFPGMIPPGGTGKVRVELNSKIYTGEMDWEGELRSNDPTQPRIKLVLTGVVDPVIEIAPMHAAYIRAYADEIGSETLRVINHDERPLKIVALERRGEHFVADVREIRAGREFELKVSVPVGTPFGKYEEALVLITDHPTFPKVPVGVNILVQRDLQARPETVDFEVIDLAILKGDPKLIDNLFETVTLAKRGGDFAITGIRSDVPFLRVSQTPAAGRSAKFQLDVQVIREKLAVGSVWGAIVVTTDDPKFPEITIPVLAEIR
jgi:hypothetical protein